MCESRVKQKATIKRKIKITITELLKTLKKDKVENIDSSIRLHKKSYKDSTDTASGNNLVHVRLSSLPSDHMP